MADSKKPVLTMADVKLEEMSHGQTFQVRRARVAPTLGLEALGCSVLIVPPGKRAYPFHRHHVMDELFFIVSGEGQYRFGDDSYPVRAGDIIAAPAGSKAHQLINTGKEDLRYLGMSSMGSVDVIDYPDSDKSAVGAGIKNADFKTATYAAVGRLTRADYWDGEDGPERK